MNKRTNKLHDQMPDRQSQILAESTSQKPLLRNNFLIMIAAIVMIIVGFILMGGSSSGVDEYNPDIFSTRRIVVGPTICFLGFVILAIGIIIKPRK